MDIQRIRVMFAEAVNPDPKKRAEAEEFLAKLEKDPHFVLSIPDTFMGDVDPNIKKISSIFYKNGVVKHLEDQFFMQSVLSTIVDRLLYSDKVQFTFHREILRHIISISEPIKIAGVLERTKLLVESSSFSDNYMGLVILLLFQGDDVMRYDKDIVMKAMDNLGPVLVKKLEGYLSQGNMLISLLIMKYITKMTQHYNLPSSMEKPATFGYIFKLAINILEIQSNEQEVLNLKKWALRFINRTIFKAFRNLYRQEDGLNFILEENTIPFVYNCSKVILQNYMSGRVRCDKIAIVAIENIQMVVNEQDYFAIVKDDIQYLVKDLVLELHKFTENDQMDFEDYQSNYIKNSYNSYSNTIRDVAGRMFLDLMKKCKIYENIFDEIFGFLRGVIYKAMSDYSEVTASYTYGAISMICLISEQLVSIRKGELGDFIIDFIFPFLCSRYQFLQAISIYSLQFFDGKDVQDVKILEVFKGIVDFMRGENEILKFNAVHSVSFFFRNETVQPIFKTFVPEIFQLILAFNQKYDIESLSDLLEMLIDNYTEEITQYAPSFAKIMTDVTFKSFNDYSHEKLSLLSGHLRTIIGLTGAVKNVAVLNEMFEITSHLVAYIVLENFNDFFMEAIDILAVHTYNTKNVDSRVYELFKLLMSKDKDDLICNVDEMTNLIDNVITFGGNQIINNENMSYIFKFISILCVTNKDEFFDDDHACGCRIIESLLLNHGQIMTPYIDNFIKMAFTNKPYFNDDSASWVYAMNVIMQCLVVDYFVALRCLEANGMLPQFFENLYDKRKLFERVHDKKTLLLFFGHIFARPALEINYANIGKVFVFALKTCPDAINNRNEIISDVEKEDSSSNSYDSDNDANYFSDYDDDLLKEDIYISTVLDTFDPFPYISGAISKLQANSFGEKLAGSLSEDQKSVVSRILSTKQPIQKVIK